MTEAVRVGGHPAAPVHACWTKMQDLPRWTDLAPSWPSRFDQIRPICDRCFSAEGTEWSGRVWFCTKCEDTFDRNVEYQHDWEDDNG